MSLRKLPVYLLLPYLLLYFMSDTWSDAGERVVNATDGLCDFMMLHSKKALRCIFSLFEGQTCHMRVLTLGTLTSSFHLGHHTGGFPSTLLKSAHSAHSDMSFPSLGPPLEQPPLLVGLEEVNNM